MSNSHHTATGAPKFDPNATWEGDLTQSLDGATDAIESSGLVRIHDVTNSTSAAASSITLTPATATASADVMTTNATTEPIARDVGTACVVCLDDFDDDALYIHPSCGCLLCQDCIAQLRAHFNSAEVAECPTCKSVVNFDEEFVTVEVITGKTHRSR